MAAAVEPALLVVMELQSWAVLAEPVLHQALLGHLLLAPAVAAVAQQAVLTQMVLLVVQAAEPVSLLFQSCLGQVILLPHHHHKATAAVMV